MSNHSATEKEIEKQAAPATVMFPLMALFRKLPSGHAMRAVGPEPAPKTCLQDTPEQRAWWDSSVEAPTTQLDAQRGEDVLVTTTEQNQNILDHQKIIAASSPSRRVSYLDSDTCP